MQRYDERMKLKMIDLEELKKVCELEYLTVFNIKKELLVKCFIMKFMEQ